MTVVRVAGQPGFVARDKGWFNDFKASYSCAACRRIDLRTVAHPIDLRVEAIDRKVLLAFVPTIPVTIVHAELARRLRLQSEAHIACGRLIVGAGVCDDFLTLTATSYVPMRGTGESVGEACPSCGRLRYHPLPHGSEYVFRPDLTPSARVELSWTGTLLVETDTLAGLGEDLNTRLKCVQVPVNDRELDGLGAMKDWQPS